MIVSDDFILKLKKEMEVFIDNIEDWNDDDDRIMLFKSVESIRIKLDFIERFTS